MSDPVGAQVGKHMIVDWIACCVPGLHERFPYSVSRQCVHEFRVVVRALEVPIQSLVSIARHRRSDCVEVI